jgi:hypothetical protein
MKMRGPRPYFKLSDSHKAAIGFASRKENKILDQNFKDAISMREGFTVYVYDLLGNLVNTFNSVVRFKKHYGITLHHKTLYKRISEGILFNGLKFSFTPLNNNTYLKPISIVKNSVKSRKIILTNMNNSNVSKTLTSLKAASDYIKKVEGKSDRVTMRKYINSGKLYQNK